MPSDARHFGTKMVQCVPNTSATLKRSKIVKLWSTTSCKATLPHHSVS